jgi:hypothetical protein
VTVDLPLGIHHLALRVANAGGGSAEARVDVLVRDTVAPSVVLHADPATLWPPNHGMVPVSVTWDATDACAGSIAVAMTAVSSSEPDDAAGMDDGATTGDIAGVAIGTTGAGLRLRGERDAGGPGRAYTLHYLARDAAGNTTTAIAVVTVPHDAAGGPEPLLMQVEQVSGGVQLSWAAVAGAIGYDVIRGDLQSIQAIDSVTSLGSVSVLARGAPDTALLDASGVDPSVGQGFFYLIEQRTARGGSGYGTESAPRPRVPSACGGGCP